MDQPTAAASGNSGGVHLPHPVFNRHATGLVCPRAVFPQRGLDLGLGDDNTSRRYRCRGGHVGCLGLGLEDLAMDGAAAFVVNSETGSRRWSGIPVDCSKSF